MTWSGLHDNTVSQLVQRFVEIAIGQDEAMRVDDNAKFRRLYRQMEAIEQELKRRSGDQRRALLPLYAHSNMQVRLKSAEATLAVAPEAARRMLKSIANSGWPPQAGDAGMTLVNLNRGIFKPS